MNRCELQSCHRPWISTGEKAADLAGEWRDPLGRDECKPLISCLLLPGTPQITATVHNAVPGRQLSYQIVWSNYIVISLFSETKLKTKTKRDGFLDRLKMFYGYKYGSLFGSLADNHNLKSLSLENVFDSRTKSLWIGNFFKEFWSLFTFLPVFNNGRENRSMMDSVVNADNRLWGGPALPHMI